MLHIPKIWTVHHFDVCTGVSCITYIHGAQKMNYKNFDLLTVISSDLIPAKLLTFSPAQLYYGLSKV